MTYARILMTNVTIPQAEYEALVKDAARLDYLDQRNKAKNEKCGTTYGWLLEENHNRVALTDHNFPAKPVRTAIDKAMEQT